MKSENKIEMRHKGQAWGAWEDHPTARPSVTCASGNTPPGQSSQAERGVMHPDRDDMEWRYWQGGLGRLTE